MSVKTAAEAMPGKNRILIDETHPRFPTETQKLLGLTIPS